MKNACNSKGETDDGDDEDYGATNQPMGYCPIPFHICVYIYMCVWIEEKKVGAYYAADETIASIIFNEYFHFKHLINS